jgi:pyrimidine-nucleoside phosphorylase/thymidine phosphorylase
VDLRAILRRKRDGEELSGAELEDFVRGFVEGRVADYQAVALLASIWRFGMSAAELAAWTRAMLESGVRLDLARVPQEKVDKHSTGGVGDKVSIPLAPALAACGLAVPMISGRGLGHTGGTLDKLESIPGFRVRLSEEEIASAIDATGVCFAGQTERLAPADRGLYALRDATELVESIPLIASSILSKKLAEDLDALVLDVKFGSGAFLPEPGRARELARTMLALARDFELPCAVWLTAMDRPLGRAVGHALEIAESIECLSGGGPEDLRALVTGLGGELLALAGRAPGREAGAAEIARALDEGRALGVFELVVRRHGGDPAVVRDPRRLPRAEAVDPFLAGADGVLSFADVREVGRAVVALGGGRTRVEDAIDPAVGIVLRRRAGDSVRRGESLCELHHRSGRGLAEARARLARAIAIVPAHEPAPLVLERLGD